MKFMYCLLLHVFVILAAVDKRGCLVDAWAPALDGRHSPSSPSSSRIRMSSEEPSDYFDQDARPVLVVGATGRVGRLVVEQLLEEGRSVRALVRSSSRAVELFGQDGNLEIFEADLGRYENHAESIESAVQGCCAIISVMGAVRFSQLSDFVPWRVFRQTAEWASRDHPYYGNYLAQKYLIELAEKHGIQRFVRLTGLGLAYPPYNPFTILFNTLLSFNNRWGLLCENEMYASTVPTVVLRPGGLAEDARDPETTNVQVDASGALPFPGRIGRADVAALAVAAVDLPEDASSSLTLACRWCGTNIKPKPQGVKEDGLATAKDCIVDVYQAGARSPAPPKSKAYGVTVAAIVYSLFALAVKAILLLLGILVQPERWGG